MQNVYDILKERGFIYQVSDEAGLREAVARPISLYCGFDPTAPSLHVGHVIPIMMLGHFQRQGHRPIALVGGGTGMIGDPSGKTSARPVLSVEELDDNAGLIKQQLSGYLDFQEERALLLNNAEWLRELRYIDFLRDIGRHFSVNQMLTAESYRTRLETGLNFVEFNYMLLQAYDFLYLHQHHQCLLQVGGSDQWGNILAGADLIRRIESERAYALVSPLITTASGAKMGKTEAGTVWLSPERTSPYEYYQYWVNTEDADVERFLALFTFLPMDEIRALASLTGAELRQAKEVLAFEATRLTHGVEAAEKARDASRALFSGAAAGTEAVPSTELDAAVLRDGLAVIDLLVTTNLCASRGAARRLLAQGGVYVNGERVDAADRILGPGDVIDGAILLRTGKKTYHRVLPR